MTYRAKLVHVYETALYCNLTHREKKILISRPHNFRMPKSSKSYRYRTRRRTLTATHGRRIRYRRKIKCPGYRSQTTYSCNDNPKLGKHVDTSPSSQDNRNYYYYTVPFTPSDPIHRMYRDLPTKHGTWTASRISQDTTDPGVYQVHWNPTVQDGKVYTWCATTEASIEHIPIVRIPSVQCEYIPGLSEHPTKVACNLDFIEAALESAHMSSRVNPVIVYLEGSNATTTRLFYSQSIPPGTCLNPITWDVHAAGRIVHRINGRSNATVSVCSMASRLKALVHTQQTAGIWMDYMCTFDGNTRVSPKTDLNILLGGHILTRGATLSITFCTRNSKQCREETLETILLAIQREYPGSQICMVTPYKTMVYCRFLVE